MQISYRNIFHDAWKITVQNKLLWFFGLFASFLSLESVYDVIFSQIKQAGDLGLFSEKIQNLFASQIGILNFNLRFLLILSQDTRSYFIFIGLAVITALFFWLIFMAQIYIIKYSAQIYTKSRLKAKSLFEQCHEKFWSVLGINVLIKIILYCVFIALSLPLLYLILAQKNSAIIAFIIFFILFAIIAIILSFINAYTVNYIVLKDLHILEAIKAAWQLFSKNIVLSLEIATLLFILKILSFIIVLCIFLIVFIPLLVLLLFALANNSVISIIMSLTLMILFFLIISLLVAAIFTAFYLASWTIAFLKLTEGSLLAKIVDFLQAMPGYVRKTIKKSGIKIDKKELKEQTLKLMEKTQAQSIIAGQKLQAAYVKYKPSAQKQAQAAAKKLSVLYKDLKPKLEKELKQYIKAKKQLPAKGKVSEPKSKKNKTRSYGTK